MSQPGKRPRLAAIATAFFPFSHADVILNRWNRRRPGDEMWGFPGAQSRIVSLHVIQPGPTPFNGALVEACYEEYARDHNVALYPGIREALTLNGDGLAVDGVIFIGEHGDYPTDERGVKRYPRAEVFEEILTVLRQSGRSVPVFLDKHLSWNRTWAVEMVDKAEAAQVPLLAGSSIGWCDLSPEPPRDILKHPREALAVFYGGAEVYGVHSLEAALSVLEHREGGEAGIRSLRVFRGQEVWDEVSGNASLSALLPAALKACPSASIENPREIAAGILGFQFEHCDGLRSTFLMLDGVVQDFGLALECTAGRRWAGAFVMGDAENFYANFATLDRLIDDFMVTRIPPAPIGRVLLATLGIALCADLFHAGEPRAMPTPELMISYRPKCRQRISRASFLRNMAACMECGFRYEG